MLGLPASTGALGWSLLALGVVVGSAIAAVLLRRRVWDANERAAVVALALAVGALPYVGWRIAEDLRVTTRLHGYDRAAAGPVQAYLPGYLVDGAKRYIPRDATFATAVGAEVPFPVGRAAFPSLALDTLFPRVSVADARDADYLVTWGIPPGRVAPVSRVWVARPKVGAYDAVYVGKVKR